MARFVALAATALATAWLVVGGSFSTASNEKSELPVNAIGRIGSGEFRHGGGIHALVVAPKGKFVATASSDNTVRIWDAKTGRELYRYDSREVRAVCFSAKGDFLYSGNTAGKIEVHDVAKGKLHETISVKTSITALLLMPGQSMLAVGTSTSGVMLVNVESGSTKALSTQGMREVTGLATDSAGRKIVYARDHKVYVYDNQKQRSTGELGRCHAPTISSDGKHLYCGEQIVDTFTQKRVPYYIGIGSPRFVLLCPDEKELASQHSVDGIRFWDVKTGKELRKLQDSRLILTCAAYSPDGKTLFTGSHDGVIQRWDPKTGKSLDPPDRIPSVWSAAVSPDGKLLASSHADGQIRLWDAATLKHKRTLKGASRQGDHLAWVPGGKVVAIAGRGGIVVLDPGKDKGRDEFPQDPQFLCTSIAATPHRRLLLLGRQGPNVFALDPLTGKPHAAGDYATQATMLGGVALHPRRCLAAAAGSDNILRVYDPESRSTLHTFKTPHKSLHHVAFCPDRDLIASTSQLENTILVHTLSGDVVKKLEVANTASSIAFCPRGLSFAAADTGHTIHVWDVATWQKRFTLKGHEGINRALAYTPDGRRLISGSGDSTLLVWDLSGMKGKAVKALTSKEEIAAAWDDLGKPGREAHAAVWKLAASGDRAASFLTAKTRPPAAPSTRQLDALLKDLDSTSQSVRDEALKELLTHADFVHLQRHRFLELKTDEGRKQAETLLAQVKARDAKAEQVRRHRAIQVLGLLDTPAARRHLAALSRGEEYSPLARAARAALRP